MENTMKMYVTADEAAQILGVSRGHAYKIIRGLNNELKEKGYRVISGKVPTKYFEEKFYGMAVGYRDDTISIITTIKRLAQSGVSNYSNTVKHWIENSDYNISEEKKKALETMFAKSHVSVIYGAAGTGKTGFMKLALPLLPA